jgi:hypothetical protein
MVFPGETGCLPADNAYQSKASDRVFKTEQTGKTKTRQVKFFTNRAEKRKAAILFLLQAGAKSIGPASPQKAEPHRVQGPRPGRKYAL